MGFLFCIVVNDTQEEILQQDFDRKCMDLSGFMFIVIVNDTHLGKVQQDFYIKIIDSYLYLELLSIRCHAQVSIFCAVACGMSVLGFWIR